MRLVFGCLELGLEEIGVDSGFGSGSGSDSDSNSNSLLDFPVNSGTL